MRHRDNGSEIPATSVSTVQNWLSSAVAAVGRLQSDLWALDVRERSRVAQVAMVLRALVPPGFDVDVDYRREGIDRRTKQKRNGEAAEVDLVVHHRGRSGADHNLLVAEFKVRHDETFDWNKEDGDKVTYFQEQFGYVVAALVGFGPDDTTVDPQIMWSIGRRQRDETSHSLLT